MTSLWRLMTVADRVLVLLLLVLSGAGLLLVAFAPAGARLVVTDGERTLFAAPLDDQREVALEGPLGTSRLEISANGARITDAPCPRRVCMTMGPIRQSGELIACIPNRILVRVEAPPAGESAFDLISH